MDFKTWLKETYRLKESTIDKYVREARIGTSHKWVNDKVIAFAAYQFPCNHLGSVERDKMNDEIDQFIKQFEHRVAEMYKKRNEIIAINREKMINGESYEFDVDDILKEV